MKFIPTTTNGKLIAAAALGVGGFVLYKFVIAPAMSGGAAGPSKNAVQPPNSGSKYVNASFTSNGAMSTLDVQQALNQLGALPPLVEDGVNGPSTTAAVRSFQTKMGLQVDGVVGPQTVASLKMALAQLGVATSLGNSGSLNA